LDILERNAENAVPTSAAFANTPAWHGFGTVFDTGDRKGMTVEQAIPAAGLDFNVSKVELAAVNNGQIVKNRWGVQRDDTGEILGVVGEAWTPVQNTQGLKILEDVVELASGTREYGIDIESAFALEDGRKVCILTRIQDDWQIAGEDYGSYLLFSNGHDGRLAITIAVVDVRAVCANTLNYAIYGQAKDTGRVIRIRHTTNVAERMMKAYDVLKLRDQRKEELAKQGEWLVEQSMPDSGFELFLESLMPIADGQEDKPSGTMVRDRRATLADLYFKAPNLDTIRGTKWGALQAVVEYADYHRDQREDMRLKSQLGFNPAPINSTAVALLSR
jgi:phage/plasmid-like protein (TIGR03299 family)